MADNGASSLSMIKIEGVVKHLDGEMVLDGLDLDVHEGETLVVIGRSGCGKSVLLKHIIGLMKPDEGRILIHGEDIVPMREKELDEVRKSFGMLFQGGALFDSLTVNENIAFGLVEWMKIEHSKVDERVQECLEMVGLAGVGERMPADLSGGMKKRVALARAIATGPKILLYDEPTTGVDPIMGDAINDLIISLRNRLSVTSIVVTHDIKSAYKVADRIAMLHGGKIIFTGTADEVEASTNPVVRQFITGSAEGPIPH